MNKNDEKYIMAMKDLDDIQECYFGSDFYDNWHFDEHYNKMLNDDMDEYYKKHPEEIINEDKNDNY